ncbi:MAG: YkuS family protein [Bacillota bacterium]
MRRTLTVAVEEGLTPVTEALKADGYHVVGLAQGLNLGADCFVVTGLNQDFLGMSQASGTVPVITAAGRSPESIVEEVRKTLA